MRHVDGIRFARASIDIPAKPSPKQIAQRNRMLDFADVLRSPSRIWLYRQIELSKATGK